MPIKLEELVHIEQIRTTVETAITGLNTAIANLNTGMKSAFGEMSFALLTVIDAHNKLEQRLDALERRLDGGHEN